MTISDPRLAANDGQSVVRGRITRTDKGPVAFLDVVVFDCGLREQTPVASGTSDRVGEFVVPYRQNGATPQHIRVEVLDRTRRPLALSPIRFTAGADETIDLEVDPPPPPATAFEQVRVDVTGLAERSGLAIPDLPDRTGHPDLEFLAGATGHYPTEVIRLARAYRIAAALEPDPQKSAALAAVVYAALGQLPDADVRSLARRDQTAVRASVEAAVAAGVVPAETAKAVPELVTALKAQRVKDFLAGPEGEAVPVVTALRALQPPAAVAEVVAELALTYGANHHNFWAALAADERVGAPVSDALHAGTTFLELSDNNAGLLSRLLGPERQDTAALAPEALVAREPADWLALSGGEATPARPHPVPAGPREQGTRLATARATVGAPYVVEGGPARYAASLAEAIERRYPNQKLIHWLSRDQDGGNTLVAAREDVFRLLANNPDLHLLDTPVPALLTGDPERDGTRLAGINRPQETVALVAAYQRVYRLMPDLARAASTAPAADLGTSRYAATSRLLRDGLSSAPAITALPWHRFLERYAGSVGDEHTVENVYRRAQQVTDSAMRVAIGMKQVTDATVDRVVPQAVTWAAMFGPTESCECGQCQSVRGPAAYYVDCLRFLDDAGALDTLRERRDDLLDILLTCTNTNTAIPYIDLVNELLEKLVAPEWFRPFALPATVEAALTARTVPTAVRDAFAAPPNAIALRADAIVYRVQPDRWHLIDQATLYTIHKTTGLTVVSATFQTDGNADELRAAPQHVIPLAYQQLAASVYPWNAPFDLSWAEVCEYLDRLGVRLGELFDAFAPLTTPSLELTGPYEARDAVAGGSLGMAPVEFQIVAGQKTAGDGPVPLGQPANFPEDFWGYPRNLQLSMVDWDGSVTVGPWSAAVWRIPQFLAHSGLTYVQVLDLLGCHLVNPGGTLVVASRDPADPTTCELAKLEIQGIPAGGGVALATTIHRLVRLWRRLGWSLRDLDRTLVALHAGDVDRDAVVGLSIVDRLRRRTGLDLAELACWFGELDHAAYYDVNDDDRPRLRSFYDEVFRVPEAAEPDSPFGPDARDVTGSLEDHKVRVAARLGISVAELDRLRADDRILAAAERDALAIGTLSALLRHVSLARAMGLGVDSLLDAMDAVGASPFRTAPGTGPVERANAPLRFIAELDRITVTGLTPAAAAYVFTDPGTRDRPPALAEPAVVATVNAVVTGAQPVLASLDYPPDASTELITAELVKLGWTEVKARATARFFADEETYATLLAAADLPALPADARVRYDQPTATLTVRGTLSVPERDALRQIIGASAAFKSAVGVLFDRPRTDAAANLGEVLPAERSVPLVRVPANLTLPRALATSLRFDADRRVLAFRGDPALLALVTYPPAPLDADWTAFRAGVDALGAATPPATVTIDPPPTANRFFATAADLESLLDGTHPVAARVAYALERIRAARWLVESDKVIQDTLPSLLGLDAAVVRVCRDVWAPLVVDPATGRPSALATDQTALASAAGAAAAAIVRRLHKLGTLTGALGLPTPAVAWLLRNAALVGAPDLSALPATGADPRVPWDQAAAVLDFARAFRGYRSADATLLDVMDVVVDPAATRTDWARVVSAIQGWEPADVEAVTGSPPFPNGFDRPGYYLRLLAQMRLARRCGIPAGSLMEWFARLAASPGGRWQGTDAGLVATEVKLGLRARVGRERWLKIATEVNDPLRERRRDALVAYVLSRPARPGGVSARDWDGLFEQLLIDPEMSSCMPASRLGRAIGSVQTFVQRALMSLEPGAVIPEPLAAEWNTFRRLFRIWDVNRRITITPEIWLEPDLRDDKTPLFVETESRLLQSALPAPAITAAVVEYVEGVRTLSDLEVIGVYRQRELIDDAVVDALHEVGRSNAVPRKFFYRRADNVGDMAHARWSAWEKLEVDIDSDYVLPVMTGAEAYILWTTVTPVLLKPTAADAGTAKQWEIKLAWTRRNGQAWTPKQVGKTSLVCKADPDRDPGDAFRLRSQVTVDGLYVICDAVRAVTGSPPPGSVVRPTVTVSPPAARQPWSSADDFIIWPTVTDGAGTPIRDANVVISEALSVAEISAGIVPVHVDLRSYDYTTGAMGTISGPVEPLLFSWPRPDWSVAVTLPTGTAAEFNPPTTAFAKVSRPAKRNDQLRQEVDVEFVFHRKPVLPVTTEVDTVGVFALDRTGTVAAYPRDWNPATATPFLPTNTGWSQQAYVEAPGSDDKLYLPELPSAAVLAQTPGVFRLRPLAQLLSATEPQYVFEVGARRYHISFGPSGANGRVPVIVPTFHPYAHGFAQTVAAGGEHDLLRRDQQYSSDGGATFRGLFLRGAPNALPAESIPSDEVAFGPHAAFGRYNWELFFHLPLSAGVLLTRNQRFAEAETWLHYIYDPTSVEATTFSPRYCWKFRPFFDAPPETLGGLLADPAALQAQLDAARADPFNPWAIARLRPVAFMMKAVMTYLDNKIAWGDRLFAQGTTESINEATQHYLMAHQILGKRPERVPARAKPTPQTYRSLSELAAGQPPALAELGMVAVEVSSFLPPAGPSPSPGVDGSFATMAYFCLPTNEKLLSYWDTVEDRLFKLRHCLDPEGRLHIPALFDPPIDPALLVRARAAGVDLGDVLADAAAPAPHYRFSVIAQKATELTAELRSLGAALLAALERRDGEALALLHQRHELSLLPLVEQVRLKQSDEAAEQAEALRRSKNTLTERQRYYLRLLGKDPGGGDPVKLEYLPSVVRQGGAGADTDGLALSQHEVDNLRLLELGNTFMLGAGVMSMIASVAHAIPDSTLPFKYGGSHIGSAANAVGGLFNMLATQTNYQAHRDATIGMFARRQDDWILQHNLAVSELLQIEKQIAAAEIRGAIADQELTNHRQQTENSKEVEAYLKTKFTSQQLHDWYVGQMSAMYFTGYRVALSLAKRAERAFRTEIGRQNTDFIGFGHWDSMRMGLLAGDRLFQEIKRMELAYLEENAREYEITKHVSLDSLDPAALVALRREGECEFTIPEWVFDLDYPGHHLRRLKSVAVTIPCVVGPYSTVNCTLTQEFSSIRVSPSSAGAYPHLHQQGVPADDARFVDRYTAVESIVTSTAQQDSGLFEPNLRDERYLPFEGSGAISRWRAVLAAASNSVDPATVTDLILHLRYTARDGGASLRTAALGSLDAVLKPTEGASLFRLFSMRQEFPDQWQRFLADGPNLGPLELGRRRFPLLFASRTITVLAAREYHLVTREGVTEVPVFDAADPGGIRVRLQAPPTTDRVTVNGPDQRVDLTVDRTGPDTLPLDLLIICRYTAAKPT